MKTINDVVLNQVSDSVKKIHSGLIESIERAKIDESVFKEHFLPVFSGKNVENRDAVMQAWISISGSPLLEVDVVDTSGDVIFSVPAIMDTNILDVTRKIGEQSLTLAYKEFNENRDNLMAIPDATLNSRLSQSFEKTINKTAFEQTEQRWRDIVNRYETKPNSSFSSNADGNGSAADDLIFD